MPIGKPAETGKETLHEIHAGFFHTLMLVSIIAPLGFWRIRLGILWIIVSFNAEICLSFGLLLVVTKLISRTGVWPEIDFTSSSCSEEILTKKTI